MKVKFVKVHNSHFGKIKIPQSFIDNPPNPEKLIHKMLVFSRESELDDIYVDDHFNLKDGYCSYLRVCGKGKRRNFQCHYKQR